MGRHEVVDELDLSVVLAAFNEEVCIEKELGIVCNALDKAKVNYEVLVVDDGSTDNTWNKIKLSS